MKRKDLKDAVALCCITIPLLLFFYRLVFPEIQLLITPDFGQSDSVTSFTSKHILKNAITQHTIPFWSAQIGGGYPIYANGGLGVWYIPNILFFYFLPLPIAYIASLFLATLLLGWGMYAWLRSITLPRIPAVFAGITTAISGYTIVQFTHLTIVQSLSLFPWLLFLCHQIVTKTEKKYILILAVVFSQLLFIGFAQSIFITSLFMLGYVLWFSYKKHSLLRSIISVGLASVFGTLLSAIHLLPALEFLRQLDSNGVFAPGASTIFSYPFSHLITLLDPYMLGNPANGTYAHFFAFNGSVFWENTAYVGILPLLFCAVALWRYVFLKKNMHPNDHLSHYYPFFVGSIVIALLLMTGKNSPIYFLYTFFPFTLFRVPSRFIWIFIVSLIVTASIALSLELSRFKKKRMYILIGCFIIVLQIFNSVYIFTNYHNTEPAKEWLRAPTLTQYMSKGFTLTIGGENAYNSVYLQDGWTREDSKDRPSYILRNTFTPDKNSLWNVSQIKDYSGRELKRSKIMTDLLSQSIVTQSGHATISASGEKLLSLYGISNIISTQPLTHSQLLQKAVLSDPTVQITLFNNQKSLPKAYIATSTRKVTTIREAVAELISDSFILGGSALVDRDMSASISGSPTSLSIISRENGKYLMALTPVDHETLVVVTENYYPGWRALVDGKPVTPIPVNVSQIGILVPKNSSHITLYFLPTHFMLGLWISLATLCVIVIAGILLLIV